MLDKIRKWFFTHALKLAEKWAQKTKTSLDDKLIEYLKKYIKDWDN